MEGPGISGSALEGLYANVAGEKEEREGSSLGRVYPGSLSLMRFEKKDLKLNDFAGETGTGPVGDLSLLGLEWSTSDSACLRLLLPLAKRDIVWRRTSLEINLANFESHFLRARIYFLDKAPS